MSLRGRTPSKNKLALRGLFWTLVGLLSGVVMFAAQRLINRHRPAGPA